MRYSFNLVEKPWVPCIMTDGKNIELNLPETFSKAKEIREIRDPSPIVTASIYRFLLAILIRVFSPENSDNWKKIWNEGERGWDNAQIADYLEKWKERFDLFHPEKPFYQVAGFSTKKASPISRLKLESASGNNPTLFDHSYEGEKVSLKAADAARALIANQTFAVGGGKSETGYTSNAPLIGGIMVILKGNCLFETLMFNLIKYNRSKGDNIPAWERDEPLKPTARFAKGCIDLFTWQSRSIRLIPEGPGDEPFVSEVYYAQGEALINEGDFDPQFPYRKDEKTGWKPLRLQTNRALWRDSTALFQLDNPEGKAPDCCRLVADLISQGVLDYSASCQLETFGLCTDKARIDLWRQEQIPLPLAYLADPDLVSTLSDSLTFANEVYRKLYASLVKLANLLLSPASDQTDIHEPDRNQRDKLLQSFGSQELYWSGLELPFMSFIDRLPTSGEAAQIDWYTHVKKTAEWAFDHAADALDLSGRSLKASTQAKGLLLNSLHKLTNTSSKGGDK